MTDYEQLIEEEDIAPELDNLPTEQEIMLAAIDKAEARLSQGFTNTVNSISSIMSQFSTQAQITLDFMREEFGVPLPEAAAKYRELMELEDKALAEAAEREEQIQAELRASVVEADDD